jgi:deoxyribose-phosphate aldolase
MIPQTANHLAHYFDHTLLSASATTVDIQRLCDEAAQYHFATVCINPRWIPLASDILHGKGVGVCSVVGFPLGAELPRIKAIEAEAAIRAGADEIDMVADLAAILEGDTDRLSQEMAAVLKVCRSIRPAVPLKVIVESAALTEAHLAFVCQIAAHVGVDFLKTSTGLHPAGGATVEAVRLMASVAPNCKIKAAGGIRTAEQALAMIDAGATRIGSSACVQIVQDFDSHRSGDSVPTPTASS